MSRTNCFVSSLSLVLLGALAACQASAAADPPATPPARGPGGGRGGFNLFANESVQKDLALSDELAALFQGLFHGEHNFLERTAGGLNSPWIREI